MVVVGRGSSEYVVVLASENCVRARVDARVDRSLPDGQPAEALFSGRSDHINQPVLSILY